MRYVELVDIILGLFKFSSAFSDKLLAASLARYEYSLAHRLRLQPGMKVLDIGCGIGGPMRAIARFSGSHILGINNNTYQIQRGQKLNGDETRSSTDA